MQAILSVNGNKAMNFLLQTVFEKEFDFVPVADVFHGMHIIRTEKNISALIVDVDFQPQQTWELVQHIKSSRLYEVPVILLATENSEVLKQKTYEYEVDEIFFKPFNPVDLISAVKNLVTAEVLS
jgi:DNA-binding response OmpR family regulator